MPGFEVSLPCRRNAALRVRQCPSALEVLACRRAGAPSSKQPIKNSRAVQGDVAAKTKNNLKFISVENDEGPQFDRARNLSDGLTWRFPDERQSKNKITNPIRRVKFRGH